jgi:hypothetical protein
MRRIRTACLGMAVGCAAAALAASNASALEIGRCVASPGTGKYKTRTCTTKAGSNPEEKAYEFQKNAINKHFTMAGGVWLLGTAKAPSQPLEWLVSCEHQSGAGEYRETGKVPATKQVQHVTMTWTGCEVAAHNISTPAGTPCTSAGQASGTIVSGSLTGKIGYIKKVKGEPVVVGQELHPEAKGGSFASFECGAGLAVASLGCVIGELSPPDEMTQFFFLNYSARILVEPPEQIPHAFQGSTHTCVLGSNLPDPFLVVGGDTITNEEQLEIKA